MNAYIKANKKELRLAYPFQIGDVNRMSIIFNHSSGILESKNNDGLTNTQVYKNGAPRIFPFSVKYGDEISVDFDDALTDGVFEINGIYPGDLTEFEPFIIRVNSGADGIFNLSTDSAYSYNFDVRVSDGQMFFNQKTNLTINFENFNTEYLIEIYGVYPRPQLSPISKLINIVQYGDVLFRNFVSAFNGSQNLVGGSLDTPKMVQDISLVGVFYQSKYNGNIGDWDWAKVKEATSFARENASFDQDISNIDLSSLESSNALSFQLVLQRSSSFTNGGNRLTLDFMDKAIYLGIQPFNLLKVKEYHFKRARNVSWASFLQTDSAGRDLVEAFIIEDYDKSLNWAATSYNYKNLTPQGVKEMIDSVDITAGEIMRLDSGVYNAFDLYVQTLGYIDIQDYLTQSGNTWTITT